MSTLFNEILYRPLFNALIFLYEYITFEDLGIAIILLTIVVRVILFPLFYKSFKNQTLLQKLQPEIQKIQHDHKDNREKQAQAMMELYKQHKVNPFSGFLMLFLQLPILIALYKVFLNGFTEIDVGSLYSFIPRISQIDSSFLGLINLGEKSIFIVILAAVSQYFQGKLSLPKIEKGKELPKAAQIGRQMVFIGPILTVVILFSLPAAVGLYWLTTSVFSIGQQIVINRKIYGSGSNSNNKKSSGNDGS
ncbi:MAG: hypothetical protein A2745_01100 [Candidatus Harrisonbacteria bacterium RIFCSPHIGHO2_01_FULL_44_13]|uniref:Membrane insertase YidC/Oxa/ALB C-terminal domain-containing protein n=1 Tax=Candidatus Harrisonbacteria bacterium RIFCSPLOWO2_01_FULL_44_18 TaxID=1798407 RepID=A0A1G1ZME1_9BACT|nr:MAG: hypothetical protein A2745_01100 [Candidatus Harrisonbacteria bacterium RIFCSPHIGHO2_01_FULL_44_13]OGY65721.1 MAG: hypothetical protein A3A16_03865 [Candidatus Harrisonbacteria bacterium RIFCSPLOWO2_01_FULL_44_18]